MSEKKSTLDATFAKMFECSHGKALGVFCQECSDTVAEEAARDRAEQDRRLEWADFHDNVLNS